MAREAGAALKSGAAEAGEAAKANLDEASRVVRRNPYAWLSFGGSVIVLLALLGLKVIGPRATGSKRDVSGQPWLVWLASAFLVLISGPLVANALVHAPSVGAWLLGTSGGSVGVQDALKTLRGQAVTMAIAHGVGIVFAVFLCRLIVGGAPTAGLTLRPADLGIGLMCFVLVWPPVNAALLGATELYSLLNDGKLPAAASGHKLLSAFREQSGDPWAWVMMGAVIVLGPIVEEVIYRGLLQSAALKLSGNLWVSLLLTSAIFTAAHSPGGTVPWYGLPALFVLSIGMGLAFEKTGRLGVPIVMHSLFNALNVVLAVRSSG